MAFYSKRAALALSTSAAAMCLTMPALAQMTTTTVPGVSLPEVATIPGETPLETGVTTTGTPAATANVVDVASGTIEQLVVGEEGGATTGAASLTNDGSTTIFARATATNTDGQAIANATLVDGILQNIAGPYTDVSAAFVNTGTLNIGAAASATGTTGPGMGDAFGARANSSAIGGVHQEAVIEGNQTGTTTVTHTNSGTFNFSSTATASAADSASATSALQEAVFMRAQGNGSGDVTANTTLTNNGTITAASIATATSSALDAEALAGAGGGEHGLFHIRSAVNGTGTDVGSAALVNNAGRSITVTSSATATALGNASATALGGDGFSTGETTKGPVILVQAQASGADEGTANSTITNAGTITATFTSRATSTGETGTATASTISNGTIQQVVEAGGPETFVGRVGNATLNNAAGGMINISASATANAAGAADASSQIGAAVLQNGNIIGVSNVNFNNAGTFNVGSVSSATSTDAAANSAALARGVRQTGLSVGGFNAGFNNTGTFTVSATSTVAGGIDGSVGSAESVGYQVISEPLALNVSNGGTFTVNAAATSDSAAIATATGMEIFATIDPTTLPPEEGGGGMGMGGGMGGGEGEEEVEDPWEGFTNRISGAAANSGMLAVNATATGGTATEGPLAEATATGVHFRSAANVATFTNTGTIRATAITNGGISQAVGILVDDFAISPVVPGETDRMTIVNNGGAIIARQSIDGGATFTRGTAIDTSAAPNPVDIRFTGASNVYGNIRLSATDTITIASGTTTLDGIINPDAPMMEEFAVFAAGPVGSLVGSLTVANGATLYLVDQPNNNPSYDGPAGVNVDSFTLASGSTLQLQLPSSTLAADAQVAYPYVNANTATIAGANLRLVVNTPNGLFDDLYVFDDIIDAETRVGEFATVTTNTGSVLLTPTVSYDTANNVDLRLTRVAFNAVGGLSSNEAAAAGAIETVYSPTQTGAFGGLLANLFLIDDASEYADAMNQLSGAQYAGHMQALRNNSLQISTLVSDQIDCAVNKGEIAACREGDEGLRLWAIGGINDARVRTDGNGIGHSSDGAHALLGVDYTIGNFTIGAFGGYRQVDSETDQYGGEVNSNGYQLGLLAGFDLGDFYIRANGSYSKLDGDAVRSIGILTTAGTITSEPDFRVTSIYAEAGGRLPVGQTWVTPFVGIEYTDVKLNSFDEAGVGGANLGFASQSQDATSILAGLKWAGKFGIVVPEAKVAYRNDSKGVFNTTQRFIDAPGNALFTTASPQSDKDSVMAGFSLAALFTEKVTGRIGYQGRFGSDIRDNAFFGSLVITFGGK